MPHFFNEASRLAADALYQWEEPAQGTLSVADGLESGRLVVIERVLVERLAASLRRTASNTKRSRIALEASDKETGLNHRQGLKRLQREFDEAVAVLSAAKAAGFGKVP